MIKRILLAGAIFVLLMGILLFDTFTTPGVEKLIDNPCICSVVTVGARFSIDQPHYTYGTGFVINQNTVITASHVTKASFIDVKICGTWRRGEVIRRSPQKLVRTDLFENGIALISYYHSFGEFALIRVNTYGAAPLLLAKTSAKAEDFCHWYIYNCKNRFEGSLTKVSTKPLVSGSSPQIFPFGFFSLDVIKIFAEHLEIRGYSPFGSSGSPILDKNGLVAGMISGVSLKEEIVYGMSLTEIEDFMDENSNLWNTLKEQPAK